MARLQDATEKNKEGYNLIHDSITRSKTIDQLTRAVEAAIPLIQSYKLDAYQQQRLEAYGFKKYEQLLMEESRLAHLQKTNKFKK